MGAAVPSHSCFSPHGDDATRICREHARRSFFVRRRKFRVDGVRTSVRTRARSLRALLDISGFAVLFAFSFFT